MSVGELAIRMKGYEEAARTSFPRRLPLIVRVDGKAFSKLTSNLKGPSDPFNRDFVAVMDQVATALCREIQGAQIAYVQSDEASVLVHGYKKFESTPWFDNQCQKIVSVAAAVAAATFTAGSCRLFGDVRPVFFDARAFVLPEPEVVNYMIWRQQDATRNSVQMLARHHFSHKQCDGKSVNDMLEMLRQKGVHWDDLPKGLRRGRCVLKRAEQFTPPAHFGAAALATITRQNWTVEEPPLFTQDREYVERLLATEDE
jgi:tRNA(His) 5'-end guanylyltransferase